MSIKEKLATGIAIGAMAASVLLPGAAFAKVKISGNGAHSDNHVAVVTVSKSSVKQSSFTFAGTNVTNVSNTGGNDAKNNTTSGGDVKVTTGDTTTDTKVKVTGGDNTNTGDQSCCCDGQDTNAVISGNGANSDNGIFILDVCKDSVSQHNGTVAFTNVTSVSNTGGNDANGNTTGGGDVSVSTGDASTTTTVTVTGGSNSN